MYGYYKEFKGVFIMPVSFKPFFTTQPQRRVEKQQTEVGATLAAAPKFEVGASLAYSSGSFSAGASSSCSSSSSGTIA